jgi:hypothetical protein
MKKAVGFGVGSPEPDPDPLVMVPNTAFYNVVKMADATLSYPPIKWSDNVFKLSTQCVI